MTTTPARKGKVMEEESNDAAAQEDLSGLITNLLTSLLIIGVLRCTEPASDFVFMVRIIIN